MTSPLHLTRITKYCVAGQGFVAVTKSIFMQIISGHRSHRMFGGNGVYACLDTQNVSDLEGKGSDNVNQPEEERESIGIKRRQYHIS